MKKTKKILALALAAVMLVCTTVAATVAYLTSQTEVVNNTFAVGKVVITLDEADVKPDGTYETTVDSRVYANAYKLYPNKSYIKDPTVHVDDNSEDCWLFVKVENGIAAIEDQTNTIAAQIAANGWSLVAGESNVYARATVNKAGDDVVVFGNFKIASTVTNETLAEYDDAEVSIIAYAVQADGFTTAAAAWAAAPTEWN